MGPDLHAAPAVVRCPACAGAVRPGAPWCGQCYADLRPVPAPPASPAVPAASSAAEPPSLSPAAPAESAEPTPAAQQPAATWPCTACGVRNPLDVAACTACGTGFLASLRSQDEPLLVLPVVGDLAALSRAARLGLACAVVLLVLLLTTLGSLLL